MSLPNDYSERVYAGVLGKIIGVYLGRPFEGWSYEQIMQQLGEIWYYVHDRLDKPLIVTDDDITGTFTFLRALPDHGNSHDITPEQIGHTWLNYIIENKSILWWGGMGNSTEHTAFLRLKDGIPALHSGSMALNSKVVSEQIGAQIFIDGWAMVLPNDPQGAADFARRAASVSHDGEAIYGAQVIAAMESAAFTEGDLSNLLDIGLSVIPQESIIATMIHELRMLRQTEPDWRKAFAWLRENYGYDTYGGGCHMIPNHGLIILSLLWGDDDFQKTQMICNTCGWDTDCNAGNVGCLMGIKNGLEGINEGPDWRGPVADRLYLPTADSGRAISDAVTETFHIVNIGRALQKLPPLKPKNGARYHFEMPGSLQGFHVDDACLNTTSLTNVTGESQSGEHSLAIHCHHLEAGATSLAGVYTFLPLEALAMPGYDLTASPTLYPGQTIRAQLIADGNNSITLFVRFYANTYAEDGVTLERTFGPLCELASGHAKMLEWRVEQSHYRPIVEIGIEISSPDSTEGTVYLDSLTWDPTPEFVMIDSSHKQQPAGKLPWVNALDWEFSNRADPLRLVQNRGVGMIIQGTREWQAYEFTAQIIPHFAEACGIAISVQGLRRYYALTISADQHVRLIKMNHDETVLAEAPFEIRWDQSYALSLRQLGNQLLASINGKNILTHQLDSVTFASGAVAVLCKAGRIAIERAEIRRV